MGDPNAPPLRARQILELLDRHGVRYVVVGGLAAVVHGSGRATFDIDLVPDWSRDNLDRLAGEYVLGTLRGRARRRFERWLLSPQVGALVKAWEDRLSGLEPTLRGVTPPPAVWRGLENRLELRKLAPGVITAVQWGQQLRLDVIDARARTQRTLRAPGC